MNTGGAPSAGPGQRVAFGLRVDARLQRDLIRGRMIRIVRIVVGVRQHDLRPASAVLLDECLDKRVGRTQRIVAGIEEPDLGAEEPGRALRLGAADLLDAFDRHARFLPGALALAALAVRQAEDAHAIAARRVQRDGAAGAPDEVGGVGAEDEDVTSS